MMHDVSLIATVAIAFCLALVFGLGAARLKMPPLVGYLMAGIVVSPATPGYVADMGMASQLAEIGVMLLMFGVGLHFSIADLLAVRKIAIPGALVQISVATLLGMGLSSFWGWGWGASMVLGLCLSVASTVVLLRALEAQGKLKSIQGQIAMGWLVVEDLVMVLVLVLLPALAEVLASSASTSVVAVTAPGTSSIAWAVLMVLVKILAFIVFMLLVGRRLLPRLLWWVARTGSQELFTLSVVAIAIGVAFGSAKLFDVSFALGAFFAGMMMRESQYSHRAADESLPLRDAFAVLFFVSVGMLFDPSVILEQPFKLLGVMLIILLGKTLAAVVLVLVFRYSLQTALTVGVSLAQIGEFSFILAGLGISLGLMPVEGQSLVVAGAILSIALNSFMFSMVEPVRQFMIRNFVWARRLENRFDPLAEVPMSTDLDRLHDQVVLVGYGRVGRRIASVLTQNLIPFVVVDHIRERIDNLRASGAIAVCGDAVEPEVLVQAHIARAAMLIVAVPDALDLRKIVNTARTLNPSIAIILRSRSADETALLRQEKMGDVFLAEDELAKGMSEHALQMLSKTRSAT